MKDNLNLFLRRLACSYEWQLKFALSKDYGLKILFDNIEDLSGLQLKYLHWLRYYRSLYDALANNVEKLNEDVIKDPIRADAYLTWHKKKSKQEAEDFRKNTTTKEKPKFDEGLVFKNTSE